MGLTAGYQTHCRLPFICFGWSFLLAIRFYFFTGEEYVEVYQTFRDFVQSFRALEKTATEEGTEYRPCQFPYSRIERQGHSPSFVCRHASRRSRWVCLLYRRIDKKHTKIQDCSMASFPWIAFFG